MILQVEKLSVRLADTIILDGLDFEIAHNEFVALLGPNGTGKSTILRTIIGYNKACSGMIRIAGQDTGKMSQAAIGCLLSYVPQSISVPFNCPVAVFFDRLQDPHTARLIDQLNINSFIPRFFNSLSGGEKQRVLFASALSRSPSLLLLDELTQYADSETTLLMGNFLKSYREEFGLSVLAVSHDLKWVQEYMDRSIVLGNKCIADYMELSVPEAV